MMRFIRWYYGSANLKMKLIISYGVLALLPLLLLGSYSYSYFGKSFLDQARLSMNDTAVTMRISMENFVSRENDNLRYLTYHADFRRNLESSKEDLNTFTKMLSGDVEPVFWYFITSDENLDWIRIYSPYLEHNLGDFCYIPKEVEEEDWYQESKTNFKTIWRVDSGKIYAARTILDVVTSSESIGVLELELNLEKMTESIRYVDGTEGGTILLDEKGRVLFQTKYQDETLSEQIKRFIIETQPETFTEEESFFVSDRQELSNGWTIYYFRDRSNIDYQLRELKKTTFLLMGSSFGFLMLLATLVSNLLSERILRLKEAAEEISRGNFGVEMDLRYEDEIGVVSRSFVRMQKKMDDMMEETYRLGMEKRKIELTALQAKINPHFLYNCLSSIKWKAIRRGEDDIVELTGLLAKFYRSTLNGGRAITTVGNELETITSYLELQKGTHDHGFRVICDFEEDGKELLMPNFLLQPLVENAIIHGIDTMEEGNEGKIIVTYRLEKDYIVFQIKNTVEELEQQEFLEKVKRPAGGYGLYNIKERIRLYYDDPSCTVIPEVEEGRMVCFTVRIHQQLKAVDVEQDSFLMNR